MRRVVTRQWPVYAALFHSSKGRAAAEVDRFHPKQQRSERPYQPRCCGHSDRHSQGSDAQSTGERHKQNAAPPTAQRRPYPDRGKTTSPRILAKSEGIARQSGSNSELPATMLSCDTFDLWLRIITISRNSTQGGCSG